jgi:hypothetical protein
MLKKSHISNIEIYSEEWHKFRRGRFTSSKMSAIAGGDKAMMTYIYHKVGESITGQSIDREFDFDEDLDWGKLYEPDAIRVFGQAMGVDFLVVQKLICDPESNQSTTPDALWVVGECLLDSSEYNVRTVEVKCPRTYHYFIPYFLCSKPEDLKKIKPDYFWQVVDQMDQCGAAVGYFMVYHPHFKEGRNFKIITFNKRELWADFMHLTQRKKEALAKFSEIRDQMLHLQPSIS